MQSLLRLAGWGVAASLAMAIAVVIAQSGGGRQRLSIVAATVTDTTTTKGAKAEPPGPTQMARLAATETETRLLTEMVRSLNNDKEQLLARLTALEQNLEDVTGSIRRQTAAPPAPPTPPVASTESAPAPNLAPEPSPAPLPQQASSETAMPAPAESPERSVSAPEMTGIPEPESARERQPAVGVDLGAATSFDGLRALWKSLFTSHAGLFEGLHPVVSARESSKSRAAELRLVVGPVEDYEAASQICAKLTASKRSCRPVAFEGGPLALTTPESPRRSKSVPGRKAARPGPSSFHDP